MGVKLTCMRRQSLVQSTRLNGLKGDAGFCAGCCPCISAAVTAAAVLPLSCAAVSAPVRAAAVSLADRVGEREGIARFEAYSADGEVEWSAFGFLSFWWPWGREHPPGRHMDLCCAVPPPAEELDWRRCRDEAGPPPAGESGTWVGSAQRSIASFAYQSWIERERETEG